MKRFTIMLFALAMIAGIAVANEKLTGVNNIKFGWKYDRCVEAIGDVQRKLTTEDGDGKKFSYSPAMWGRIEWSGSVLDFYQNKLFQVGFYKKTASDDRTAFEQSKVILTAAYGSPASLNGQTDSFMWRASNGNLAILQYSTETSEDGVKQYATYLFFVDNKEVVKKAKRAEKELRELMKGN